MSYLGLGPELRRVFLEHHSDLFGVEAWRAIQSRIRSGDLIEVLSYREEARLPGTDPFRGW